METSETTGRSISAGISLSWMESYLSVAASDPRRMPATSAEASFAANLEQLLAQEPAPEATVESEGATTQAGTTSISQSFEFDIPQIPLTPFPTVEQEVPADAIETDARDLSTDQVAPTTTAAASAVMVTTRTIISTTVGKLYIFCPKL